MGHRPGAGSFGAYLFDLSVGMVRGQAAAIAPAPSAEERRAAYYALPLHTSHELALVEDERRSRIGVL